MRVITDLELDVGFRNGLVHGMAKRRDFGFLLIGLFLMKKKKVLIEKKKTLR